MAMIVPMAILINELNKRMIKAAARVGDEMVRVIEEELEWLNLVFPNIHRFLSSDRVESIRQMMVRAQDVVNTFPRSSVSQRNTVTILKKLKKWRMMSELRRLKHEITDAKYELSELVDRQLLLPEEADQGSDVPSSLRNFVFYFLLFPAGSKIPARRLIALWIAEGFIQPKKYEIESVEDIGEHHLNELIRRNVVCVVERKSNGKVKTCKLNDGDGAVREQWLALAKEKKFLPDEVEDVRRLVDSSSGAEGPSSIKILGDLTIYDNVPKYRDIISFLSFDDKQGRRERDDIGYFIKKCILAGCFQWLKVIDLERVFRPVLPERMGELALLKYLGLRWTYLLHLPEFVKGLLNLEVLDVKHTYITILPTSIWQMQSLRHLYLSEAYRTRFPSPTSTISLDNLQTLWGAFVDDDTCVQGGLDTLRSIRKLGLSCRSKHTADGEMPKQLKAIAKWISNLKLLQSLRLKSRDAHGRPDHLCLTSLESNTNLSTVYLLGKLDPIVLCKFPVSLTDITLSGSELDLDPLEFLERLPNLQSLQLLGRSVMHTRIRCSRRGFPQLKVLCVWKLENLEELKVEEGSLPCLEELDIRSCHNLQSPPDGLPHIYKLKKFKLGDMTEQFKHQSEALLEDMEHVIIEIIELDQV